MSLGVRKVVYDCDGVLLALNEVAHAYAGIDLNKRTHYRLRVDEEAEIITKEQAEKLLKAYNSVETFKKAKFYPGSDGIVKVEKNNAAVYIHSLSYNEEITNYKRKLLQEKYPKLPSDRFILESGNDKSVLDDIDVLVEDCLENVLASKARLGNVLIRKPYNCLKNYGLKPEDVRAVIVEDLIEANTAVMLLLTGVIKLKQ